MIAIVVMLENKILIKCSYLFLEPYAPTTSRTFIFKKVVWEEINYTLLPGEEIKISITVEIKNSQQSLLSEFRVFILDWSDLNEETWSVSGLVIDEYNEVYKQGLVDVFETWSNKKEFDWFSLPPGSSLKKDYISACLKYSGLSNEIKERDVYTFDMALIKEERDFLFLASLEFIGEKGYFGHNFYTFDDCLLNVFHKKGYFFNKKILFLNVNNIVDARVLLLYEEIKDVFLKFKFIVEEM